MLSAAVGVSFDVCTGVAHAHSRGIAHRDLRPDNVVVGGPNETVVLDWGLARDATQPDTWVDSDSGEVLATLDGQVFGTPLYMSPEPAAEVSASLHCSGDSGVLGVERQLQQAAGAELRPQEPMVGDAGASPGGRNFEKSTKCTSTFG